MFLKIDLDNNNNNNNNNNKTLLRTGLKKLTLIYIEAVQIFYHKLDNIRNYYVIILETTTLLHAVINS